MATITIQFDPAIPSDVQHAFNAVYAYMKGDVASVEDQAHNEDASAEEQEARRQAQAKADAELLKEEEEKAEADKKAEAAAKRKEAAAKKKADEEAAAAAVEAAADDDGIDGEEEEQSSAVSREEVRKALKEYSALEGKSAAIQILKDHGASSMSELKEEHFEAVLKIVNS